ncbi:MAG: tripartite tricarboxylate transporter TctB family protein [Rhodospirillales bacterium]|nr:tripartite tricarboxylate transporter TctB family protein [Rhodospirillales bacterium]
MKSDRLFGLISLGVALAYIASASQIETSFIMDPMGPKAFPIIIGSVLGLAALVPILRPDADPQWPDRSRFMKLAIALVVLMGYALVINDLGFLLSTTLAAGLISYQISAKAPQAALIGVSLAVGLYAVFNLLLGLSLVGLPPFLGR